MSLSEFKDGLLRAVSERYISNKWLFSTMIAILALNGKGILYFIFSDAKGKLDIIKNFDYGFSFVISDVIPALILSIFFICVAPIFSALLDKYIFNYSEAYRRKVERDFKRKQIIEDGLLVEVELENTREHKEKIVIHKLQCAQEQFERLANEKRALENIRLSLEANIEKLKSENTSLNIENEHNRKVCELSRSSAKYVIDSVYHKARDLLMYSDGNESSNKKFFHELNATVDKMKALSEELRVDRSFEPKTIEFLMGIHPPQIHND